MVIAVCNIKGGVGKSTLASNLAVMASRAGHKTLLVDADTQRSSMAWRIERESDDIQAVSITHDRIHREVAAFDHDFIIIDAGGRDTGAFRSAIGAATLCLVPLQPSQADVWSSNDTLAVVRDIAAMKEQVGLPFIARMILNQVPPTAAIGAEVRTALAEYEPIAPLLETQLGFRVDYKYALGGGWGVAESAPASKAAGEVAALWQEVLGLLSDK